MDVPEIRERELLPEKARNGVDIGPRYEAIAILERNDFTVDKIARALDVSKRTVTRVKNHVLGKYDLTNKNMVSLAGKAHKAILQAAIEPDKLKQPLPFNIKGADVTAAIDRVYERVQPVIRQNLNLNASVDLAPVDVSRWLDKP
jgi:predicted transcriptional regulator